MGFASAYLEERALFPAFIEEAPLEDTGIIIVVPAYDEPGISFLLDSLSCCTRPSCSVEVIIVVNAPVNAGEQSLRNNMITVENIKAWMNGHPDCFLRINTIVAAAAVHHKWGVGMARKCGMDEAVRRFSAIGRPDGIILSLDADCQVESNYLAEVYTSFYGKKNRSACSIYFEHPLSGNEFSAEIYSYITLYELHLRYYYQALEYSGFPYVYHTVGSATAVRALPYVRAGGMNRKQAGEDFYFIQKLIPAGGYFSLNTTTVYPSPRPSFRVPFGTGASIGKMTTAGKPDLKTYNFDAFRELRTFFTYLEHIYSANADNLSDIYVSLPRGIRSFMDKEEMTGRLIEIKDNTSGYETFRRRFFSWFNMFRIVKYLNHVHSGLYTKTEIVESAIRLLNERSIELDSVYPVALLKQYRILEHGN